MLPRLQLLLLAIFFSTPSLASAEPQTIRVSIGVFSSLNIRGVDLVFDKDLPAPSNELSFQCDQRFSSPVSLHARGGFIFVNNKPYRGTLTLIPDNEGCLVVNTVEMEKYIAGLLNKEMLPSWPLEALKAQAVASRTYALYQREQNKKKFYDVESTTQDQVYDGADTESAKSNLAAQNTDGVVLTWKHHPVKAFYHANCGGRTESPEDVWGYKYGYFKPVICPYHKKPEDQKKWTLQLTVSALEKSLRKVSGLLPQNFIRVASVEPGTLNEGMRRQNIIVSDISGNSAQISANAFRNAVGNNKIKSTAFEIKRSGASLQIDGQGNGHGVGMCQVGAKVMASQGKTFRDILKYYYPLAKLERLQ